VSHWFLVGRDLMWFAVGSAPLVIVFIAGTITYEFNDESVLGFWIIPAMLVQWLLLASVYWGWIR
jgi:hypothetical protein